MSTSRRPGKEPAAPASRKRERGVHSIPPAPALPRGQTRRYGIKAVHPSGKNWYKRHAESRYLSDMPIDDERLGREYPAILRQLEERNMQFLFAAPKPCNLHMVREFYANYQTDKRTHYITVRGVEVPLSPMAINEILGTPEGDSTELTELNIQPPYQDIRHTLCGVHSTAKWVRHGMRGYHSTFPYAHLNKEARIWTKIVMHSLIPGLHFTEVTRDRVCLVYAFMKGIEINVGAVIKSTIRKSRVHRGRGYAFGGLITELCIRAGVPQEQCDYMPPLPSTLYDVTNIKAPDYTHGPVLTTQERAKRDDMITARMFGLEMLRHRTGGRPSTDEELREVERRYPLNEHAMAVLGLGPDFYEPTYDDVPTDEDKRRTGSDVESDLEATYFDPLSVEDPNAAGDMDE
jgi:hypothetical protein